MSGKLENSKNDIESEQHDKFSQNFQNLRFEDIIKGENLKNGTGMTL